MGRVWDAGDPMRDLVGETDALIRDHLDRVDIKQVFDTYSKRRASRRSTKANRQEMEATYSYIIASLIRHYAIQSTHSVSIKTILAGIKLKKHSNKNNLRIPHYWAPFYHDGWRGGVKKKGMWLFFPKKGKMGGSTDPRRPSEANLEKRRKDVKRMTMVRKLSPQQKKEAAKNLKRQGAVWCKRRKGFRGDPFFTKAEAKFRKNAGRDLRAFFGQIMGTEITALQDMFNRHFGRTIRAKGKGRLGKVNLAPGQWTITWHYRSVYGPQTFTNVE